MTYLTRAIAVGAGLALTTTLATGLSTGVAGPASAHPQTPAESASRAAARYPAAGSRVPDQDPFYRAPKGLAKLKPGAVVRVRPTSAAGYGSAAQVRATQIAYRTEDTHGRPELTVTTLIWPRTKYASKGHRPIVSLQLPEDSTGTQCSPSYTIANNTDNTGPALVRQFINDGYAIAVPDHEGPQSQFLAGREEGHATLDGLRAINHLKGRLGLGRFTHPFGLTGYSGGANATAWAAQLAPHYAPELRIVGAAIGGTPSDPIVVARYLDGGATAGFEFGAAYGLSLAYPEAHIERYLNDRGRTDFAAVAHQCEADILQKFALRKLSEDTTVPDALAVPSVVKALHDDTLGRTGPSIPVFDYHANTDEIVPVGQDDTLVQHWCHAGTTVQVLRDPAGEHVEEALVRAGDAATYLEQRFAGMTPTDDC